MVIITQLLCVAWVRDYSVDFKDVFYALGKLFCIESAVWEEQIFVDDIPIAKCWLAFGFLLQSPLRYVPNVDVGNVVDGNVHRVIVLAINVAHSIGRA